MSGFLTKLLELLEKYLPTIITSFLLGHRVGAKDKVEVEVKLQDAEVELERERNRRAIEEANKVFTPRGVISRAIAKGRDLLRGDK